MNWTDIAVLVILASSIYFGWRKGFVRTAIEFSKWILSIIVARLFYVPFTKALIGIFGDPSDQIAEHVRSYLYTFFKFNPDQAAELTPVEMSNALSILKLPMQATEKLRAELAAKAVATTTDFIGEVAVHVSHMILYALGFLLLIVLMLLLFSILQWIGDLVTRLPVLKQINKGGGFILGAAQGIVMIYFIMALLSTFSALGWTQDIINAVEQSTVASFFYRYNILQYVFSQILLNGKLSL